MANLESIIGEIIPGIEKETKSFRPYVDKILPKMETPEENVTDIYKNKEVYLEDLRFKYASFLERIDNILRNPEAAIDYEIDIKVKGQEKIALWFLLPRFYYWATRKYRFRKLKENIDIKCYIDDVINEGRCAVCDFKFVVDAIKDIPDEVWHEEIATAENPTDVLNKLVVDDNPIIHTYSINPIPDSKDVIVSVAGHDNYTIKKKFVPDAKSAGGMK